MTDTTLFLGGKSTDNIWLMEDGLEPYVVGMRLDCGDAGVVYMTREQARHLGESLLKSKPSIAGGVKRYSDSEDWGMAEAENGEYVKHADHLTILASKEEEIKAANSQVERLKGLLREFRDFPIEHLASCNMCDEDDIGCSCGLTNCRARISEELK